MKIIGFASQLAMGKDTAADYLAIELNRVQTTGTWERGAFANAVKDTFCRAFNVDREFLEKWKRIDDAPPGMKMNIRKALQFVGDGFRQIVSDIWIDIALRDNGKQLIVSDCRYINEAKNIRGRQGINVIMYRTNYFNNDTNPSESQIKPIIEWCLKTQKEGEIIHNDPNAPEGSELYDYFLINDKEIVDLHYKIRDQLIPFIERAYNVSN